MSLGMALYASFVIITKVICYTWIISDLIIAGGANMLGHYIETKRQNKLASTTK